MFIANVLPKLLPTGSDGSLAPFWNFLFAMSVFYHIAAQDAIANARRQDGDSPYSAARRSMTSGFKPNRNAPFSDLDRFARHALLLEKRHEVPRVERIEKADLRQGHAAKSLRL